MFCSYMNARQLAGYIAEVELEDHARPDPERMRMPSWARAEHRWARDYDAFNAHLAAGRAEQYVIKLPPGVRCCLFVYSVFLCSVSVCRVVL